MLDCIVIGGGHSGLMCAHLLQLAGVDYQVLDRSARAGDVWRNRPRNLRLFTSRQFCALSGLAMPGDPSGYPSANEFADHVESFARQKSIKVSYGSNVVRLSRAGPCFVVDLENGTRLLSKTVINATGSNQTPRIPEFSKNFDSGVEQIAARDFLDARQLPANSLVAVVGDGASGRQIAMELAPRHRVVLARGRKRKLVPNQLFGKDVFWWLKHSGVLFAGRSSLIARILRERDPIPVASANDKALAAQGIDLKRRAVSATANRLVFQDGSSQSVDAVVWCGGYQENLEWIDLPNIRSVRCLDDQGGLTREAGFFVVGRKWLTCRASELILGCERDASRVVGHVLASLQAFTLITPSQVP
jgi:putative flavoprotein involved in K+ transport